MDCTLALLVTVFGWWFSTGLILLLNHLPVWTHRWSMAILSIFCIYTLNKISATSSDSSAPAAVLAFGQALVIWGWLEMGYLMGFVTGPSNSACPSGATGWTRFSLALKTSLYHELLVVWVVFLVIALTAGGPNQVTALSCMVLWLMRWSAKLNLFLGVTNFHEEWLPKSQRYLASYINQRRINKLLPFSLLIGAIFSGYFFLGATHAAEGGDRVGRLIIGFLLALGVIEHLFLVLPVNDSKLWHWALAAATGNKGDDRLDIQTPAPPPRVAEQRGG